MGIFKFLYECLEGMEEHDERIMVEGLECNGYKVIDKYGNDYWEQHNQSPVYDYNKVLANYKDSLRGSDEEAVERYLVEMEIDDSKTIIQKIENEYVGDDCVQVVFKHTSGMAIIKDHDLFFCDLPRSDEFGYINNYLHDDRRHQFPYSDTPVYREKKLYSSCDCVNQLLDYDTMYDILRADKKNKLESKVYCKAIKDGENAIIVQSTNQNSPAFNMNLDELRNIAKSAPQPKIRVKNRDKTL